MIRIVTDSTCDLLPSVVEDLKITVLPYYIHIGDEEYLDGIDMSRETFYQGLPHFKAHPTTAAPSTETFRQTYDQLAAGGATAILSIHISNSLSSAVDFAHIAAQETTAIPVKVHDSGQLSQALGWMVEKAAKMAARGEEIEDIISVLEEQGSRSHLFAALDTLTYMRRSGRISSLAGGIGSLLQVKPILKMYEGVAASERVRTSSRAFDRLLELLEDVSPVEMAAVVHSHAPDRAQHMLRKAAHLLPDGEIPIINIAPVLGVHIGPGIVGFACVSRK